MELKKLSEIETAMPETGVRFVGVNATPADGLYDIKDLLDYVGANVVLANIITDGPTPVVHPDALGGGTGVTANIGGDTVAGDITVTTGLLPGASRRVVSLVFSPVLPATPKAIFIQGANDLTADLSGSKKMRVKNVTNSGFDIYSGSTSLDAVSLYSLFYLVIG